MRKPLTIDSLATNVDEDRVLVLLLFGATVVWQTHVRRDLVLLAWGVRSCHGIITILVIIITLEKKTLEECVHCTTPSPCCTIDWPAGLLTGLAYTYCIVKIVKHNEKGRSTDREDPSWSEMIWWWGGRRETLLSWTRTGRTTGLGSLDCQRPSCLGSILVIQNLLGCC